MKTDFADIRTNFNDMIDVLSRTRDMNSGMIKKIASEIIDSYKNGNKLIVIGNGGSYSDASHFAGEFVGAYLNRERPALPALVPANLAAMTAISNDFDYDDVFCRFVEANANPGDVVIGMSTSGDSMNVVYALKIARGKGAKTVAFTGETGGKCKEYADLLLNISSKFTPNTQIAHYASFHIICDLVETELFGV
jgi:D-sedoheptulose 7-phosphate isomerase